MPKLTALGDVAVALQPLPKDFYKANVHYQALEYSRKSGAPMLCLQFQIDEGEYSGRLVPSTEKMAYRIMVGGTKEDGSPHDLGRFFSTINALKAEWACGKCNHKTTQNFVKEKSKYHCPNCGAIANEVGVETDTDDWMGLRCRVQVDLRDIEGFEEPVNEVKGLRPLPQE
jgi:hypothetical protein